MQKFLPRYEILPLPQRRLCSELGQVPKHFVLYVGTALALLDNGVSLAQAMGAARAIYGEQYNPVITLKSLTYFGDGDLHRLSSEQKARLLKIATAQSLDLPIIPRLADKLAPTG